MSEQGSDAEVMAASLEAPERFTEIFDRHYRAVRSYLRRRIDSSAADDLAAETFVVAFRRRGHSTEARRVPSRGYSASPSISFIVTADRRVGSCGRTRVRWTSEV